MHAQEHFLRQLLRPRPVGHASRDECPHQPLMLVHQFAEGVLVALPAPLDDLLFGNGRAPACYNVRLPGLLQFCTPAAKKLPSLRGCAMYRFDS